jgi:hypothetical protein
VDVLVSVNKGGRGAELTGVPRQLGGSLYSDVSEVKLASSPRAKEVGFAAKHDALF